MNVEKKEDKNSFYISIRWVLVFGQLCGLIPVRGIFGPSHKQLRFTWKNPLLIYTFLVICMTVFFGYALGKEIFKNQMKIDGFAPTAFYSTCLIAMFMFLNLARKLPEIASDFYALEESMKDYPKNLGLKMKIFIFVFGSLAVAEHSTMIILNLRFAMNWHKNVPSLSFGQAFFKCMLREVSDIVPYSPVAVAGLVLSNVICTLTWNYIDFFLIAISIQLSSRLQLINERVSKIDLKMDNPSFWIKTLQDFNLISCLVKKLDHILSKMILISLANDFYHISLQLLRALRMHGGTFQNIYFYCSMCYLITRLLTLAFCMSRIEDESKKSLDTIFSLKEPSPESNRFLKQVLTDDVYFTANRFFVINRSFMITVIGTIITYQVILYQFESLNLSGERV